MATRIPASQRTREELTALIEGRLSIASAKDELVKLATRLIVEEALEGEAIKASEEHETIYWSKMWIRLLPMQVPITSVGSCLMPSP
jgi:hypothetical protein